MYEKENSFIISGNRFMERPGVEPNRSKVSYWNVGRGVDDVAMSNTEYISRLTSLRDSLIDQEQTKLAQAFDRLRLQSISNRASSVRLRLVGSDEHMRANQRRSMLTTVEKFRRMRPKRHQPVIFPIQGKQLLDSPLVTDRRMIGLESAESSESFSDMGYASSRSLSAKIDETVNQNLQRLIHRTTSIPNIGRKAIKQQEPLEPKTRPLLHQKGKLYKQTARSYPNFVSPYVPSPRDVSSFGNNPCLDSPDGRMPLPSPQTHRLGPTGYEDTIDSEKIQQYYQQQLQIQCSPAMNYGEGESGEITTNIPGQSSTELSPSLRKRQSPTQQPHSRRAYINNNFPNKIINNNNVDNIEQHSPNNNNNNNNTKMLHFSTGYQFNKGAANNNKVGNMVLTDLPDISACVNNYNGRGNVEGSWSDLHTAHRLSLSGHPENVDVQTSGYRMYHRRRPKSDVTTCASADWSRPSAPPPSRDGSRARSVIGNSGVYRTSDSVVTGSDDGKIHIVVDMPSIIFNAASPDRETKGADEKDGHRRINPNDVSLAKTVKQQEIRQKELHNLLEDVKELNIRSDNLSAISSPK